MAEDNQVRIAMRASDNAVQEQIDRLNAKLEEMKGKVRDVGRSSSSSTREAKQGFDELGGGIGAVGSALDALAAGAAFATITAKVKAMVDESLKEIERLSATNRTGTTGLLTTLGVTGDVAHFEAVQRTLRTTESAIGTEEGRTQVFRAIRDAAPSLPVDRAVDVARLALSQGADLAGGDAATTAAYGGGAARLTRAGFAPNVALDVAAMVQSAQGGQAGFQYGMNLAEIAGGGTSGPERMALTQQALALSLTAAQSGLPAEFVQSSITSFGGYRRRKAKELARQFEGQGMSPDAAMQAAMAQVGNAPLGQAFFDVLNSGNQTLMEEAFGEGGVRMRAVSLDAYRENLAAIEGAGGYVLGQVNALPASAQNELATLRAQGNAEMRDIERIEQATERRRILDQREAQRRMETSPGSMGRRVGMGFEQVTRFGSTLQDLGIPGLSQAGEAITAGVFTDNSGARFSTRRGISVPDFGATPAPGTPGTIVVNPTINITQDASGQVVDYSANYDSGDVR